MRLLLFDEEKITKLVLPEVIDGVFLMKYTPEGSKVTRDLIIEAEEGKWFLKGSTNIGILESSNSLIESIELTNYMNVRILLIDRQVVVNLYCLPTLEENNLRGMVYADQITIGNSNQCSIVYNNNSIANLQATIIHNNGWYITPPSENFQGYIFVNGKRVKKATNLVIGDIIFINGLKITWMGSFLQTNNPNNSVYLNSSYIQSYKDDNYDNTVYDPISDEDENVELYKIEDYFFHTPNLKQYLTSKEVNIDPPPTSPLPQDSGLITASASITMLASSFATGFNLINNIQSGIPLTRLIPTAVTFIAMIIGSILMPRFAKKYNRRVLEKKEQFRVQKYTSYLQEKNKEIATEMNKQIQILNTNYPSIVTCLKTFNINNNMVWSREIKDQDFLEIRLGTGNREAEIKINAPEEHFTLDEDRLQQLIYKIVGSSTTLEDVPITFSLLENKISAIISSCDYYQDYINSLIAQIAIYHCAADLKIVFLTNKERNNNSLSFAKFLPHCFNEDKTVRFYSENSDEMKILSSYLMNIYNERVEKKSQESENEEVAEEKERQKAYRKFETYYLIITDDFLTAKSLPITETLLNSDDNYGFSYLILDNSIKKLPNQCKAFINVVNGEGCVIERNLNNQTMFKPEYASINMREIGTRLLNIPLLEVDEQSSLPTSLSFLEMFGVSKIEQLNILNRWRNNDPTISLSTPIGVHTSGEVFNLDLHEKAQGPHGLIAGSTGSGKSEFIITFILSMCVNYHPDEVQFVLIDYKGGGLAGAFEKKDLGKAVPHIAGTITNLDAGEINRSLVSINSELKRRQRIFNESKSITGESTIDIYKYQKYYREGIVKEPISHLFIISDEFAELKAQQPEFMTELVSTARIGRSLGVHLILATQKPSGVVNEQIWSNTRFRVCLKVASKSDSMEMLKRPEAASIKETGRYYLQVGYDEYFDIGQSGWAGAKYVPSDTIIKQIDDSINFINNTGSIIKSVSNLIKKEKTTENGDQLTNITKYLMDIAEKSNYQTRKLWLDNIPEYIYIGNLSKKYSYTASPYNISPIIGEYDDPEGQKQALLTLDLTSKGNTIIYGASGVGQDNLLSTIIYSSAIYHRPEEVNFYVIDLGAETLKIFNKLPHVGDICTIDNVEKITNLLVMLDEELDRRKDLFADYNGEYSYYIEKGPEKLPQIVCIINNYDVFLETFRKMGDLLEPFYRECSKYGICFIITCSTMSTLRSKVAEYFTNKLCLRMAKDEDYRNILNSPKGLVPANYKGRGIVKLDKKCYEFQSAYINVLDKINDTIKDVSTKLIETYNTYKIKRVPVLPDVVTLDMVESDLTSLEKVPIGFNVETKSIFSYDFYKEKINIISSNELEEASPFIYALSSLLTMLKDYNFKVVDFTKTFDILKIGGKLISSDFDNVITTISNEIKDEATKNIKNIYFFIGLSNIKSCLQEPTYNLYNIFMKEAKNFKNTNIIIYDTYNNIKKLQLELWYLNNVNKTVGIWIGDGVGTQTAISYKNLLLEYRKMQFSDMAFANDKSNVIPIRKVIVAEEKNEE